MALFAQIYRVVRKIPAGKVATYGQIARVLGMVDARKVGWALHANRDGDCPCYRVVSREGRLARNFAFDRWREQKRRLEAEGVRLGKNAQVELAGCQVADGILKL